MTIALDSEPVRINPLFLTDLNSHMLSSLVFRGLTKIEDDGTISPDMAEKWEIKNGGKEIVFYLKQNIYWHDGVEFSAEDVIFTYNILNAPDVASPRKGLFGPVERIFSPAKNVVVVRYKEPYGSALESWTFGIIPEHLGKRVLEPSFDTSPVGTGPYKIKKWDKGKLIQLEAYKNYYEGSPKVKDIVIKFIVDPTTRLLELKSGKVDVAELPVYLVSQMDDKNLVRYKVDSFRYVCLGFNLNRYPFNFENFRKAVAYSINKKDIIRGILNNDGLISTGPYPRNVWYYNPKVIPFEYNPDKAKEILKNINTPIKFSLYVNNENKELQKVAQIIEYQLSNVGIDVDIRMFDWQTLRHRIIEERNFDAILLSRAYLWDPDIFDLWHSSKASKSGWNIFSFKEREVDKLLELGRRTLNFNNRKIIYHQVHQKLYEKQACIFLYETPLIFLANKKVKGIKPSSQGFLNKVWEWYID